MPKVKLEQAVWETSQRASAFTLHWTRKFLLKKSVRWLAVVLVAAILLIFEFEGITTPPRSARDWWGTIAEVTVMLYASYRAQLYNESALITGLALDTQLEDEPYTETLVKQSKDN